MGSGGRTASVREAKAERRQGQPRDCVCVGPCHSPAVPTGQAVAGRTPSILARQQDFPRAPLARHQRAAGFHSCPPCSLRPGVWSAGAQGSFAAWVGRGKEGEAASAARVGAGRGAEAGLSEEDTRSLLSRFAARSDAAFCHGFFAEWDPQSLSVSETWHTEQLGKTRIHLHLSSAGAWEDRGKKCREPDACVELRLPSIKIKVANGERDQRDVAVSQVQSNVLSEALSRLPTSAFCRLRPSSGFLLSLHHGDVS